MARLFRKKSSHAALGEPSTAVEVFEASCRWPVRKPAYKFLKAALVIRTCRYSFSSQIASSSVQLIKSFSMRCLLLHATDVFPLKASRRTLPCFHAPNVFTECHTYGFNLLCRFRADTLKESRESPASFKAKTEVSLRAYTAGPDPSKDGTEDPSSKL